LLKGGKISDYNGRTMSVLVSSTLQINPDIPEAHALRGWYDQGGCSSVNDLSSGSSTAGAVGGASSQTNWKSLEQVREEQLGFGEKADYFSTLATVTFAKKENSMYQACKSENCNKKVVDQNNGYFRCEKCNKEIEDFKWRMVLSVCVVTYTWYFNFFVSFS
jgi:replication factor A1